MVLEWKDDPLSITEGATLVEINNYMKNLLVVGTVYPEVGNSLLVDKQATYAVFRVKGLYNKCWDYYELYKKFNAKLSIRDLEMAEELQEVAE